MTKKDGGWSSPQVIMTAISMVAMAFGSYLAIQRDDSDRAQAQLSDQSRRLAIVETRLEYLMRERDQRDRRRDD